MRNRAQTYPSIDEVQAKKKEFLKRAMKPKVQASHPLHNFLAAISSEIKQSLKGGASNTQILKAIQETYGVKVSHVSFSNFCKANNISANTKSKKKV